MKGPIDQCRRGRRRLRLLLPIFSAVVLAAGLSAVALQSSTRPASAAPFPVSQCNGVFNTPGLTVACQVTVVNTLTDDPTTTGSVVTTTDHTGLVTVLTSTDIVSSVTQCNTSARGGGGTLNCSVDIINNITMNGPAPALAASVDQCNGNQPDGLGSTAPIDHSCNPVAVTGTGATIFQCNNRTGNGGGLVSVVPLYSHCLASGTVSASLPITVNQCNEDAADGGGARVRCTTSITTNVVDTATAPTPVLPPVVVPDTGTPVEQGVAQELVTPPPVARPIPAQPSLTG